MSSYLALNEDNSHYFMTRGNPETLEDDLENWMAQYAQTQVRALILNVNAMKTSYDSAVWDTMWSGYDPDQGEEQALFQSSPPAERAVAHRWVRAAWQLHQAGIDLYARWISRSREEGLSPIISIRMNDVHNVQDESNYIHSSLWRERPDLRRISHRFAKWTDRAFDYAQEEVRIHHFNLIREVVQRYDLDGLELDWMRFYDHFRPGFEAEGSVILTSFMREVRQLLDAQGQRLGRKIRLSVRVPARPDTALAMGLDAAEWARQGLIDQLVITPFWETVDTDMPIEIWKRLLAGTDVSLGAGLELLLRPYPESPLRQKNSLETVRGAAASLLARGADYIYLFNYMDSMTAIDNLDDYPKLLREVGDLETMQGKARRHIVTYADTRAPGTPRTALLPLSTQAGQWGEARLHIGTYAPDQETTVRLAFAEDDQEQAAALQLYINGVRCSYGGAVQQSAPCPQTSLYVWAIPEEARKSGSQVIEWHSDRRLSVEWVEIAIMSAQ